MEQAKSTTENKDWGNGDLWSKVQKWDLDVKVRKCPVERPEASN